MNDEPALAEVPRQQDRPERVTVSTDLFEAVMNMIEQLPLGQVHDLWDALRNDVKPDQ